jgi:imidazolonepropionase-like amidohydrolase
MVSGTAAGSGPEVVPLVIRGAKLYPSPSAPAIDNATVLLRDGRIAALGTGLSVPPEARVIPGEGRVVMAGFWNAHVHFTEAKWRAARRKPVSVLSAQLTDMLTSRGFTTVVDTGSDSRSTMPLRRRIESGELPGPRILTSGPGIFPPRGIPYYLAGSLPFWIRPFVPTPSRSATAERIVKRNIARGADLLKLFTGSYIARGTVRTMPEPIARAAAAVAHAHGQLVYSHPSNLQGTRVAVASGVDVLAHPPDTTEGVERSLLKEMVDRRMAMIPTLKMFAGRVTSRSEYLEPIYDIVHQFHDLGGQVLFGTDVGFMPDYSTEDEFRALARSGLDARGILRSLTTAPAQKFGGGSTAGTLAAGEPGDLTVLDGDPMEDVATFSRVRATVRSGRVVYQRS